MKFTSSPYVVDKDEEQKMLYRVETLKETLTGKQKIHLTLITTYGLIQGKHTGKYRRW